MGGLWAKPSAKLLGKDLFYCAYHESTQIMDGGAGLPEELRNQFMRTICIQWFVTYLPKKSWRSKYQLVLQGTATTRTLWTTLTVLLGSKSISAAHTHKDYSHWGTQQLKGVKASMIRSRAMLVYKTCYQMRFGHSSRSHGHIEQVERQEGYGWACQASK